MSSKKTWINKIAILLLGHSSNQTRCQASLTFLATWVIKINWWRNKIHPSRIKIKTHKANKLAKYKIKVILAWKRKYNIAFYIKTTSRSKKFLQIAVKHAYFSAELKILKGFNKKMWSTLKIKLSYWNNFRSKRREKVLKKS